MKGEAFIPHQSPTSTGPYSNHQLLHKTLCKRYRLIRQPPIPVGGQEQHLNFVNKLKAQPEATLTHQIFLRNHKISALPDKGLTERTNHSSPYNNIHHSYRPHGLGSDQKLDQVCASDNELEKLTIL